MSDYLMHFNPNHDKWGRFTFTRGERRALKEAKRQEKKDNKWAKRNYNKIFKKAYKPIRREMAKYVKKDLNKRYPKQLRSGETSKRYIIEYNRKLAELMNMEVSDIRAPSGKAVKFVAKRGELGVHMAIADLGYDMDQLRSGVYDTGRVAYKDKHLDMA